LTLHHQAMQGCLSISALAKKGPAPPRDLQCVESWEESVKLVFNPGSTRCLSKVQSFAVLICGGPAGDLRGPREEIIPKPGGSGRITCDIAGLIPSTEYTITICSMTKSGKRSEAVSLEVRTADQAGQAIGKGDFNYKTASTDPKETNHKGKNSRPEPGTVQVNLSSNRQPDREDDTSTVAPSEHDDAASEHDDAAQRDTSMSDDEGPEASGACPATQVIPVQPEDIPVLSSSSCPAAIPVNVVEDDDAKETPQCKLCSILDCLKQKTPAPSQSEVVVLDVDPSPPSSSSACAAARPNNRPNTSGPGYSGQGNFRPNRPAFPGKAISYEPITAVPRQSRQ